MEVLKGNDEPSSLPQLHLWETVSPAETETEEKTEAENAQKSSRAEFIFLLPPSSWRPIPEVESVPQGCTNTRLQLSLKRLLVPTGGFNSQDFSEES